MGPRRVEVVCLLTGEAFPNLYVERLHSMLRCHLGRPFGLTCLTDRQRDLSPEIRQLSVSEWPIVRPDMRPTQRKLRLFDRRSAPFEEFLYMDVTLVIKGDMAPLLDFVDSRPEPLAIYRDWHYDCVNSCVMRIRQDDAFQAIYEDYAAGKRYPVRLSGDQDYLNGVLLERGLMDRVAILPAHLIVSYKALRRLHRKDVEGARSSLEKACILKFHGTPRPHELLSLRYRLHEALRVPRHVRRDWGYLAKEVRAWWR